MAETEELIRTPKWRGVAFLGSGTFGSVQLAENLAATDEERRTGEHLKAVKIIPLGAAVKPQEITIHSELRHGNIVRFIEAFPLVDAALQKKLCIVMERALHGNLWEMLERPPPAPCAARCSRRSSWALYPFNEPCARWILQQIVLALQYMHAKQVYNRDLKPQNVLITNFVPHVLEGARAPEYVPVVKLCDFGYSKCEVYAGAPISAVGTPSFMAPEMLRPEKRPYHGAKVDAWACGIMLMLLLTGELPFSQSNEVQQSHINRIVERVAAVQFVPCAAAAMARLSSEVRALLSRLLARAPEDRYDMSQMLEDPWLRRDMPPAVIPWQRRRLAEAYESLNDSAVAAERHRWRRKIFDMCDDISRAEPSELLQQQQQMH